VSQQSTVTVYIGGSDPEDGRGGEVWRAERGSASS